MGQSFPFLKFHHKETLELKSRSAHFSKMDFKEINFNPSPVKRIRFRGDPLQVETEPLIDNDVFEDASGLRNGEAPRERGLFTFFLSLNDTQSLLLFCRSSKIWITGLPSRGNQSRLLS